MFNFFFFANIETVLITPQEEKVWFYHRVLWEDMNNDGHLDAVTARAYGSGGIFDSSLFYKTFSRYPCSLLLVIANFNFDFWWF